MARTEKKFGEVNLVPGSTYSTLVPSSANRRNVIVNATATSADNIHLVTSSGTISATVTSPAVSVSTTDPLLVGSWNQTNTTDSVVISPSGTKGLHSDVNTNGSQVEYFTITPSATQLAFTSTGTNASAATSSWAYGAQNGYYAFNNAGLGTGKGTLRPGETVARHRMFTNSIKWGVDEEYFLAAPHTDPSYITSAGGSNASVLTYGQFSTRLTKSASTQASTTPTNYGIPVIVHNATSYTLTNTSQTRSLCKAGSYHVAGIHHEYTTTTTGGATGVNTQVKMYSFADNNIIPPSIFVGALPYVNGLSMPVSEIFANFCLVDYNSVHGVFACPSGSIALTDANMYWVTVNSSGDTLSTTSPITTAVAGFRLVDNSTYATQYGLAHLSGAVTYPSAPTGVTVPSSKFPTVSVKFSPNGKYIAVAYDRDYSGTGDTNSVVVVYTRQSNGTYSHTHSSGSVVSYRPEHFDAMAWTPDNSGILVRATDNKVYVWYPGLNGSSTSAYTITYSGSYPSTPAFAPAITASGSTSAFNTNQVASAARTVGIVLFPGLTGATYAWVYPSVTGITTQYTTGVNAVWGKIVRIAPSANVTATNYVNTVANGLPIPANSVTQISNIVLEANEKLEVDATTGSRMNVTAYGVEIS
jgi:hypothetical protein